VIYLINEAGQAGAEDAHLTLIPSKGLDPMPKTNQRYLRALPRSSVASQRSTKQRTRHTHASDVALHRDICRRRDYAFARTTSDNDEYKETADRLCLATDRVAERFTRREYDSLEAIAELVEVAIEALDLDPAKLRQHRRNGFHGGSMDERMIATVFDAVLKYAKLSKAAA
jgi:hypothetical protein